MRRADARAICQCSMCCGPAAGGSFRSPDLQKSELRWNLPPAAKSLKSNVLCASLRYMGRTVLAWFASSLPAFGPGSHNS